MKNFKRILALVLATMMVVACMVTVGAADVVTTSATTKTYNAASIDHLGKLGIFKGYTNGTSGADDNVTREQMALFTGRVITGKTTSNYWENYQNDTTFTDINNESAEYVGAIAYAYGEGIVVGKSDVRFDPKANVSYQDALTMVVRSLGYTGLSYPNGYINKAIKLGLTADVSGVAYTDAAKRGVIATVLYNALYAEDSLFAKNFNLTSGTYMLVATPAKKLADGSFLDAATIGGYVGKTINAGFVAFAPLTVETGRVVNGNYVYAKTEGLGLAGDATDYLGYAFNLTFEGDNIAWVEQCATKVFKNYGDDRDITKTAIKYVPAKGVAAVTENFLTLGNQAYSLVDILDKEHAAPTTTRDFILYNVGAAAVTLNEYEYFFDASKNYVDLNGNILLTLIDGEYYAEKNGKYVLATDEDYDAALQVVSTSTASDYEIFAQDQAVVKSLSDNYFCDITAFDYDGDGVYDAGIYTPYYVGRFNNVSGTSTSVSGGLPITIKNTNDYIVTGAFNKATAWVRMMYSFNKLNNHLTVLEKLNNVNSKVVWASKGTASNGVYTNSQVKFANGTTLKIGGWTNANLSGLDFIGIRNNFETSAQDCFMYNGWNDVLLEAMKSTYKTCNAYAVAGHLIWAYPVATAASASYDFVAFDPYASEFSVNDDKIVVTDALVDATGVRKSVTINSVEGETFGNIEYMAFVNYIDALYGANANIIKYSYFFNETLKAKLTATQDYKNALRALVWEQFEATTDDNTTFAKKGANTAFTQFFGVAGQTDGAYDLLVFKQAAGYGTTTKAGTVTFKFGVADNYFCTKSADSKKAIANTIIATTDKTVFTIVGQDGIVTYTGKPVDGYQLVLTAGTLVYCANADQVMLVDETRTVNQIALGDTTWTVKAVDKDGTSFTYDFVNTWAFDGYKAIVPTNFVNAETYLITKKTANKEITVGDKDQAIYSYTNLYDLAAQKYVDKVFVGNDATVFNDLALNGKDAVSLNAGAVITIAEDGTMVAHTSVSDAPETIFNYTKLTAGVISSFDKDNTGAIAHVTISGTKYTVRNVSGVIVTKGAADVITDMTKIENNATIFFAYDAVTGDLSGYMFNK